MGNPAEGIWMLKLVALLVVGAGTVLGAIHRGIFGPRARARRRLASGSRHLVEGDVVTVTGIVRALDHTLTAPLSGRNCVVFASSGRFYEVAGNRRNLIDTAFQLEMVPFELETATERILVEGATAELELPPEPVIPRSLEREASFAAAHGQPAQLVRSASFDEVRVVPGAKVSVHGLVEIAGDPDATAEVGYREGMKRKIRLVAHPAHPLTIGRPTR